MYKVFKVSVRADRNVNKLLRRILMRNPFYPMENFMSSSRSLINAFSLFVTFVSLSAFGSSGCENLPKERALPDDIYTEIRGALSADEACISTLSPNQLEKLGSRLVEESGAMVNNPDVVNTNLIGAIAQVFDLHGNNLNKHVWSDITDSYLNALVADWPGPAQKIGDLLMQYPNNFTIMELHRVISTPNSLYPISSVSKGILHVFSYSKNFNRVSRSTRERIKEGMIYLIEDGYHAGIRADSLVALTNFLNNNHESLSKKNQDALALAILKLDPRMLTHLPMVMFEIKSIQRLIAKGLLSEDELDRRVSAHNLINAKKLHEETKIQILNAYQLFPDLAIQELIQKFIERN